MTAPTRESVMELVGRLRDEADLCRNETAEDVARLLDEAADALEAMQSRLDEAIVVIRRLRFEHESHRRSQSHDRPTQRD